MSTGILPIRDAVFLCLCRAIGWSVIARFTAALLLLLAFSFGTRAQEHWPSGSVGKLEGQDISVEGGAYPASIQGATTLFVSSGSVVTVHSGAARLALTPGSFVDICGPAKFTLLESGGAFTVALNFGRVRLRLTEPIAIRVYTPFIVATSVAIANESRDFTLGLDVNDLMCVYAAKGAAGIEQQFGGENLIVPELGEFFLPGERLPPIAGKAGSCRCESYQPPATAQSHLPAQPAAQSIAPPPVADNAPSHADVKPLNLAPTPRPVPPSAAPVADNAPDANKGFDLHANANRTPPVTPPASQSRPEAPAVEPPVWKVIMPPLSFSASLPAPPADSGSQVALAIPEYHVDRDWVFTGRVEDAAPPANKKNGESNGSSTVAVHQRKKAGFWGKLKRFFGNEPPTAPASSAASPDSRN
ncbi:MAG: hypothetical protein WA734_19775 [Candidatus Acidiferrales bacterium]